MKPTASRPNNRVAVVFGTRPEIIKLAGIVRELGSMAETIHLGQHTDPAMTEVIWAGTGMGAPTVSLAVDRSSRAAQIGSGITALAEYLERRAFRAVVVQGDTNSTLAGGLAGQSLGVPVVHVEAGLRSYDWHQPEEHNRRLTDHLSDVLCVPTELNRENLLSEGLRPERIHRTGNTIVEAVKRALPPSDVAARILQGHGLRAGKYVLSTIHRPESTNSPETLEAILTSLHRLPISCTLVVHPRLADRVNAFDLQRLLAGLHQIGPTAYGEFLALVDNAAFVVSDSGGVQEEVSVLKQRMVVAREFTERPEVLGTFAHLVPPMDLSSGINDLARELSAPRAPLRDLESPYGDGTASTKIASLIRSLI